MTSSGDHDYDRGTFEADPWLYSPALAVASTLACSEVTLACSEVTLACSEVTLACNGATIACSEVILACCEFTKPSRLLILFLLAACSASTVCSIEACCSTKVCRELKLTSSVLFTLKLLSSACGVTDAVRFRRAKRQATIHSGCMVVCRLFLAE